MSRRFEEILAPHQGPIEAGLRDWFDRVFESAPQPLREAAGYSLFAGGKRLRPLLVVLANSVAGGCFEQAVPAAVAVEMVHTYSLIHDDLPAMDDDDLRRGRPTCHIRFGEASAILAGDALLTAAFEVLAGGYEPRIAAVTTLELARGAGAVGMVGGQALDLAAEGRIAGVRPETAGDLEEIHRRKTGALFRSAIRLGLLSAGWESIPPAADRFARAFGLAFQIADDLIDAVGSEQLAGKRVGKDAERGKLTYPGLLGISESRRLIDELHAESAEAAEALGENGRILADLTWAVTARDR